MGKIPQQAGVFDIKLDFLAKPGEMETDRHMFRDCSKSSGLI